MTRFDSTTQRGLLTMALTVALAASLFSAPPTIDAQIVPNDPLMAIVTGQPNLYQWGPYALNLPAAWAYNKGHAYIGILDEGIDTTHVDLRPYAFYSFDGTTCSYSGSYQGGNFRHHRSYSVPLVGTPSCDVNEDPFIGLETRGHGTHVSGIIGATTNNAIGVAGTCWNCPLIMTKLSTGNTNSILGTVTNSLLWLIDQGAQIVNLSFGFASHDCEEPIPMFPTNLRPLCAALDRAEEREIVIVASPGNDLTDIEFPANDPRVISVGGIESDGAFWDERDNKGCPNAGLVECGSNFMVTPGSAEQDVVAPARQVLSTFYPGTDHNTQLGCGDSLLPASIGYGPCTGTSMSSPMVAGSAGILRSVNPLLNKETIRTLLIDHADGGGANDPQRGFGLPDVGTSVLAALGSSDGIVLPNRLTPVFRLFSPATQRHLLTTVPQVASARVLDARTPFDTSGPATPGYGAFPGVVGGAPNTTPGASFYVLTGDRDPGLGQTGLTPLYRLTKGVPGPLPKDPALDRATAYAIGANEINTLLGAGYFVDGIEGYLLDSCDTVCSAAGGIAIHRRYHVQRTDFVLATTDELASFPGYGTPPFGLTEVIGFAFPNLDTDSDTLIDGFEALVGTDVFLADSDCDGTIDGTEVMDFPYGDPLDGACETDLAAALFQSFGGGDHFVVASATNLGPGDAPATVLRLSFASPSLFTLVPLGPASSCTPIDPGAHTGHRLDFDCAMGTIANGASADRSWRIPDDFLASITITATVSSAVPDPVPKNNLNQIAISTANL